MVEVVIEGMTDGGLVLLPPPLLQPTDESALTLVQTVYALLQQLEAFLQQPGSKGLINRTYYHMSIKPLSCLDQPTSVPLTRVKTHFSCVSQN